MEYRVLGRTGVKVSALALGTANFADPTPEEEAKQILAALSVHTKNGGEVLAGDDSEIANLTEQSPRRSRVSLPKRST